MTFKVAVNADKTPVAEKYAGRQVYDDYLPEEESLQVLVDLGLELDAVLSAYNKRNKSPEILNEIKLGSSGILTVRDEAMKRGVEKEKQTRALQFADFFNKSKDNMVQIWNSRTEAKKQSLPQAPNIIRRLSKKHWIKRELSFLVNII
jgi:hypothetical protein